MISVKRRQLMLLAGTTALPALMAFADENVAPSLLHLGVISDRENQPDHVLMQYSPLLDHLRQTLEAKGIAVGELRIARNTAELARFVRNRQVDIVIESMMATFRINAAEPLIKPALAAWRKGRRETRSVFFVRQNSPIKHLGELAGKTLALDSPRSTTAYTLPRIVLRQHGLVTEALATDRNAAKSVRFVLANAEINQACQVDRGRVDAAAFDTESWDELPKGLRQELRIIHTTEPILHWLLSVRTGLPPPALAAIHTAVLDLHASDEGTQALQKAGRIRRFDRLETGDLASIEKWHAMAMKSGFGE